MNDTDFDVSKLETKIIESIRPLLESFKQVKQELEQKEQELAFYAEELTKAHKKNTFLEYELQTLKAQVQGTKAIEPELNSETTATSDQLFTEPPAPPSKTDVQAVAVDENHERIQELEHKISTLQEENDLLVQTLKEVKTLLSLIVSPQAD